MLLRSHKKTHFYCVSSEQQPPNVETSTVAKIHTVSDLHLFYFKDMHSPRNVVLHQNTTMIN